MKLQTFDEWWNDKVKVDRELNGRNYTESDRLLAKSAWDKCQNITEYVLSIPAFTTEAISCKTTHSNKKSFGSYIECLDCGSIYFNFNAEGKKDV